MTKEEALDLLKQGDAELWNQYRKEHPNWKPDLEKQNLSKTNFAPFGKPAFDLTNANLIGCKLPELDKLVPFESRYGIDFEEIKSQFENNMGRMLVKTGNGSSRRLPLSGALIDRTTTVRSSVSDRIFGFGNQSLKELVKLGARFLTEEESKIERAKFHQKVFISYAWKDEDTIKRIEKGLIALNLSVIRDKRDFSAGEMIDKEIKRAMSDVDTFLLFHSEHTDGKHWIEFERSLARKFQQTAAGGRKEPPQMIYVVLDDAALPKHEKDRIAIMAKGRKVRDVCQEIHDNILHLPKTGGDLDIADWEDYVIGESQAHNE
jgi:TIR domain